MFFLRVEVQKYCQKGPSKPEPLTISRVTEKGATVHQGIPNLELAISNTRHVADAAFRGVRFPNHKSIRHTKYSPKRTIKTSPWDNLYAFQRIIARLSLTKEYPDAPRWFADAYFPWLDEVYIKETECQSPGQSENGSICPHKD